MGAELTETFSCHLFECLYYVFLRKTRLHALILSINAGGIRLSMADSDDDPIEFAELFKERILSGSVGQDLLPLDVCPCIDCRYRLYSSIFKSDAESSLSKRRQGSYSSNDCSICSSFFFRMSTNCHFIDDKNILLQNDIRE